MAGKARYVKVAAAQKLTNYAGYKVVGAVNEDAGSYLLLERPEQAARAKAPRKVRTTANTTATVGKAVPAAQQSGVPF
jgi:hypothetical protein